AVIAGIRGRGAIVRSREGDARGVKRVVPVRGRGRPPCSALGPGRTASPSEARIGDREAVCREVQHFPATRVLTDVAFARRSPETQAHVRSAVGGMRRTPLLADEQGLVRGGGKRAEMKRADAATTGGRV